MQQQTCSHSTQLLLSAFGGLTILSLLLGIATEWYFLAGVPVAALVAYIAIVDFKKIFYLLLGCLPLSTEINIGSFGTDLPTEPLILGLMGVFILYLIKHPQAIRARFVRHPISLLLFLHLAWTFVTMLTSAEVVISLKFFLAKTWYVCVFYFLAAHLIRTKEDIKQAFWWVFIPLTFTMLVILVRHAGYGFTFEDINWVLSPFYRNHVSYACIMAVFFPLVWYAIAWYWERPLIRWGLIASVAFFLIAIYFSYTRAAYVALILAAGVYVVMRLRLTKIAVGLAMIAIVLGIAHMINRNTYLEYAPNYERTITHKNFDNLLEATYNMEDISTMERLYRWVAGFYMVAEKPAMGFGPGNFYTFYKAYTVRSFQTYVSDNPEQSGIHNYYLMLAVEQGIIGVLFFLLLCFYVLIKGEQIYHQIHDQEQRYFFLPIYLGFVIILAVLIINDLIETDKVGSFFFIFLALLVNFDLQSQVVPTPKLLKSPKQ